MWLRKTNKALSYLIRHLFHISHCKFFVLFFPYDLPHQLAPIKLNRYSDDLLFYLFYVNGGDVLQLAAAAELWVFRCLLIYWCGEDSCLTASEIVSSVITGLFPTPIFLRYPSVFFSFFFPSGFTTTIATTTSLLLPPLPLLLTHWFLEGNWVVVPNY